jgi:hypothetical protein
MVIAMPPSTGKVAEVLGLSPRRLRERLEAARMEKGSRSAQHDLRSTQDRAEP